VGVSGGRSPELIRAGALGLLLSVGLAGCASPTAGPVVTARATASSSYNMPLSMARSPSTDALIGWPGAAGRIVRCVGPVIGTTRAAPYDGEDTGAAPEAALATARKWAAWSGVQEGFTLARVEASRRLYVFEVAGVAKQALILRHGPALNGDGTTNTVTRWWLESWARCDYAELPEAVAQARRLQLWSDAAGQRQPTSVIKSFQFSGGCFPGMTALDIGGPIDGGWNKERRVPVEYFRNPAPELRHQYFEGEYAEHVSVPRDAIDSGYERDGEHLWMSSNRGVAYVGAASDAEAWPRAKQPIRCG
jgi:hypothetical protein